MAADFNLPGSSFEELQKIVKGYSHAPDQASLDALAKLTGIHATTISRSNRFLSDISLIAGGRNKTATELGRKLGRALDHRQPSDAQHCWKEAVQTNEKVSSIVTTVRIKGGMTEKDLSSHILYVSGQKNTASNRTGARTTVEVLLAAGLLSEENGKLVVSTPGSDLARAESREEVGEASADEARPSRGDEMPPAGEATMRGLTPDVRVPLQSTGLAQIAINIQLHLPETENPEVYENLFKALREQLLDSRPA
jgi:hypothetical protein